MKNLLIKNYQSRRRFLKNTALVASTATIGQFATTQPSVALAKSKSQIIIIGAGFAGLASARELVKHGYRVTVLEARNRVGGRVHTDRSTGIPLDMGASWIHGIDNNPIYDLALESRAVISKATDYNNQVTFDVNGERNPVSIEQSNRFRDFITRQSRKQVNARSRYSLESLIYKFWKKGKLNYLDNIPELNYVTNINFEHEYTGDAGLVSAQQPWEGEDLAGDDVVFPDGYDQLTDYLARGIDIRKNTTVKKIRYDRSGVTVTPYLPI